MTLQDVAERAGTSRTTAHYVLTGQDQQMRIGEETRRRVLRAAKELRYRPDLMARGLRTRVTRTIALIADAVASEAYAGDLVAEVGVRALRRRPGRRPRPRRGHLLHDRVAMGVYQALAVRGRRVPGDLSLVSFDDSDLAVWLRPALSSVALPHRELAVTAVDLLLADGAAPPGEYRVPLPLRLRESIAAFRLRTAPGGTRIGTRPAPRGRPRRCPRRVEGDSPAGLRAGFRAQAPRFGCPESLGARTTKRFRPGG